MPDSIYLYEIVWVPVCWKSGVAGWEIYVFRCIKVFWGINQTLAKKKTSCNLYQNIGKRFVMMSLDL